MNSSPSSPSQLHIHLAVFPNRFVICFFHNGILSMPTFINLNHADILLLSHHFVSWLWSLPFPRWDPFCHHKDQGNGVWESTGETELKTKQLTFAEPKPAGVLSGSGRGSGLGKAGWEKPWTPGDVLGKVSTTSPISRSEFLSSEKVVLPGLTMPHPNTVKAESTWEPGSFQIREEHQEDSLQITYSFSWIAAKPPLALLSLISGHAGEENKSLKNDKYQLG